MITIKVILFISLFILFFSYIGYGIAVAAAVRLKRIFRRPKPLPEGYFPETTLVVAAYNEAGFIREKIANTLALDYPEGKLHILFITDGSTDGTDAIVSAYPSVRLMHEPARLGKTAALNRAMQQVHTPIVIFCDANTLLNDQAVKCIVRHYQDPRCGGVAGEKKVIAGEGGAENAEGIYWKYESLLKRLDAELFSVVGAAGELFSVRTELYRPVEKDVVLDDFIISLRICAEGYRIAYAPDAYAMESPSAGIGEEHKRKVRISAGGFQAISRLGGLLNFFKHPVLTFQYLGHRVLRWTLAPLSLPVALIANIWLVMAGYGGIYTLLLAAQCVFYAAALTGWALAMRDIKFKPAYVPFYFVFMNVSIYEGFFRFIRKKQQAAWDKAVRAPTLQNS
ncbi:glycosyltransferase family 2 protein [Chitinophaga sp. NPDC101104]|uniref:glycosyltransferase family 2 protein n=1 Tax=Chitinophaga sp. NPDC101104 TaxID=3390561 RepID=UPI003CFC48FC